MTLRENTEDVAAEGKEGEASQDGLAQMAAVSEHVAKTVVCEKGSAGFQHGNKNIAYKFLRTLRKQTREKPRLVAAPSEAAVLALGNLLSALDNPNLPLEQKEMLDNTLKKIVSDIPSTMEGSGFVVKFIYEIVTATAKIFEAIAKYSDFSLEELDGEIDSEQTENSACPYEIESEVEDTQEQEFMTEETNKAGAWALPISLDEIENKFYESTVQAPGLAEKTFFCPNNAETTMRTRNSYAKYGQDETPIIVYDDTVFGECNRGFLLTDKNMYTHNLFSEPRKIPIPKIKNVALARRRFGTAELVVNGIRIELTQIHTAATETLRALLEYIVFGKEAGEKDGRL